MGSTESFGAYLRRLRVRSGKTLREVEDATQGAISNAYLSQIEGDRRSPPKPNVLVALAKTYNVAAEVLFERAGYSAAPSESDVEVAFAQVLADRNFQFGTRVLGELNADAKRTIVELYEQVTGKTLLPHDGQQ